MRLNAACSHRVSGGSRGTAHVYNLPVSAESSQSRRTDSPLGPRGSTSCLSTHDCFKSRFHNLRSCSRSRSSFIGGAWNGGREEGRGTVKRGTVKYWEQGALIRIRLRPALLRGRRGLVEIICTRGSIPTRTLHANH